MKQKILSVILILIMLALTACNMPSNEKFLPTMQVETTPTIGAIYFPTVVGTPQAHCFEVVGTTVWETESKLDLFVHFWPIDMCQAQTKITWSLMIDGKRYADGTVISNPNIGDQVAFSIEIPKSSIIEIEFGGEIFQITDLVTEFSVVR